MREWAGEAFCLGVMMYMTCMDSCRYGVMETRDEQSASRPLIIKKMLVKSHIVSILLEL